MKKQNMKHIDKVIVRFYNNYRDHIKEINKMSELDLDNHLERCSKRYKLILESCFTPLG